MTRDGAERFAYVATFERLPPLQFRAFNARMAEAHAYHVAWQANDTVVTVRRTADHPSPAHTGQ